MRFRTMRVSTCAHTCTFIALHTCTHTKAHMTHTLLEQNTLTHTFVRIFTKYAHAHSRAHTHTHTHAHTQTARQVDYLHNVLRDSPAGYEMSPFSNDQGGGTRSESADTEAGSNKVQPSSKRAMGDIGRSSGMKALLATQDDGVREGEGCFVKAWSLISLAPRGPRAALVAPVAWPHRAMG